MPATAAIRVLRAAGAAYTEHRTTMRRRGDGRLREGTRSRRARRGEDARDGGRPEAAADRPDARDRGGLDEGARRGDRREKLAPCSPEGAHRHSGTSSGDLAVRTRHPMQSTWRERSSTIRDLHHGGRRGFLVGDESGDVARILSTIPVRVAI